MENCRTLNESFPFLPLWQAERVGDQFILGPGSPAGPKSQQTGNDDLSGERVWSPGSVMTTDPNAQLLGMTFAEPAVPYYVGTARLEESMNIRTRSVGRAVRCPVSGFGGIG